MTLSGFSLAIRQLPQPLHQLHHRPRVALAIVEHVPAHAILATTKYAAARASTRANQRSVVHAVLGEFVMGRGKDSLLRDPEQAP